MNNLNEILTYALPAAVVLFILARKKMATSHKNVKNLNGSEAEKVLNENKEILILDVRTSGEFKGGHIPGARNIPVNELLSRISEIKTFGDKPVMVYCASGGRSPGAVQVLLKNDFQNIYHLTKGISSWSGKVKR